MDADSLAPRRAMPRVRNAPRELEDAGPNMREKLFSTDPHCARVTWFRNWSVHLKLSIEKWLLIIRPNCRPIGLIPATPTPGPQRTNSKFSILNWAMHLTPARGTERGCGRRPSRSAWQMRKTSEPLHALRLVLRTQPRSDRPTCVKCIALILNDQFSLSWLGFPQIVQLLSRGLERQFHLASAPRRRVSGKHDFQ